MSGLYRRSQSCDFSKNLRCTVKMESGKIVKNIVSIWSVDEVRQFVEDDIAMGRYHENEVCTACRILVKKKERSARDEFVIDILIKNAMQLRTFHREMLMMASRGKSNAVIRYLQCVDNMNFFLSYPEPPARCTPIHMAATYGLPSVIEYIIKRGGDINKTLPDEGFNPLHFFCVWGLHFYPKVTVEVLLLNGIDLESRDARGRTPILLAVQHGRRNIVELLLKYNANLYASDIYNQMALHLHFLRPNSVDLDMIEMLLRLNCNPNVLTAFHNTPLHYIAISSFIKNKIEIVTLLSNYGVDFDIPSDVGDTALHIAAKYCPEDLDFIVFLLTKGANPGIVNSSNETFLDQLLQKNRENAMKLLKFLCFENANGNFQFPSCLIDSINSDEEISTYFHSCKGELQYLIQTKIYAGSKFSYFVFLISDINERAVVCRDQKIREEMSIFNADNFPIYGRNTMTNFQEGLSLHEKQSFCIESLTNICKNILNFYSISDTIRMIRPDDIEKAEENLIFLSNYLSELTDTEEFSVNSIHMNFNDLLQLNPTTNM